MWYPIDPDEPTSELYRLTPPRRSELREALDAATGRGRQLGRDDAASDGEPILSGPTGKKDARPRFAPFFGSVVTNAIGGILATATVALTVYLWMHFHHPGHPSARLSRPAATATARR